MSLDLHKRLNKYLIINIMDLVCKFLISHFLSTVGQIVNYVQGLYYKKRSSLQKSWFSCLIKGYLTTKPLRALCKFMEEVSDVEIIHSTQICLRLNSLQNNALHLLKIQSKSASSDARHVGFITNWWRIWGTVPPLIKIDESAIFGFFLQF